MLVDADNFLLVNNVGLPGGGETVGGCLMQHGELAPIVSGANRGHASATSSPTRTTRSGARPSCAVPR